MTSSGRHGLRRSWSIALPWTAMLGMVLALAFSLSIVLFMH